MTRCNRNTLKNYFQEGTKPTQAHFADLIDSTINQLNDGFDKNEPLGLKLTALNNTNIMSFYRKADVETNEQAVPLWKIEFADNEQEQQSDLRWRAFDKQHNGYHTSFNLSAHGRVGIKNEHPEYDLDVNGTIATSGRQGHAMVKGTILADGEWHDVTPVLEGCHMFEVVAGIGKRYSGHYAMIYAIAMNTCEPTSWLPRLFTHKNPIKPLHAYYRSASDRLKLRWKYCPERLAELSENRPGTLTTMPSTATRGKTGKPPKAETIRPYVLQIRTLTHIGRRKEAPVRIQCHLTELWHDPYMAACKVPENDA